MEQKEKEGNETIKMYNIDCLDFLKKTKSECIDIICTDPPYLYLKGQKLEREFNELIFFKECKRVLTRGGFIILFGRGVSFYRWNNILNDLGFTFKEEIVWNKGYNTSPLMSISRVHETISIFSKDSAKINKIKVPYLEMKKTNIDSVIQDVKRMRSILSNNKSLCAVQKFLESGNRDTSEFLQDKAVTITSSRSKPLTKEDRCVSVIRSMQDGMVEKTIINESRDHYKSIHPTQKPVRLLQRLLSLVIPKDKPNNEIVVLDPFGGSFSTMEAVYYMGINGISCEIDKEYFESGKKRIEYLIKKPTLF